MLKVNKPYNVNDVVALKMTAGEEYIGKLVEENDSYFIISKPIMIGMQQNPQNPRDIAVGFVPVPVVIGAEMFPTVSIVKHNVTIIAKARSEIVDAWTANTSSLIQPSASTKGIVLPNG